MALAVEDIASEVAAMRERGVRLIGDPGPGQPINRVVFVHPHETKRVFKKLASDHDGG
jgi:hypothetical protein